MLALRIAGRFLTSHKGRSLVIMLGIAVGVSVQVFVGLLIGSLQKNLINQTVGRAPQVTVFPLESGAPIEESAAILAIVSSNAAALSPAAVADGNAFLQYGDRDAPALVRGFDFDQAEGIYQFRNNLVTGTMPQSDSEIALGVDLAEELGLKTGDTVTLITPEGTRAERSVSGLYDQKVAAINSLWVLAPLGAVQELFGYGEGVSSVGMQVKDVFDSTQLAAELTQALAGRPVRVSDWQVENAQLLSALQGQSSSSSMIQVFVMLSVVIAIASILAITVMQRSRQIGILKAMGITDGVASRIFVIQGGLLGLGGAVLGVLLGIGLFGSFALFARTADGEPIVPAVLDVGFAVTSGVIALLAATVAGLFPARTSARLSPIEVIRNG